MRTLLLLAGLVSLSAVAEQNQVQSPNIGVIYGAVVDQNGTPAKGLTLNAEPLGIALVMPLPWTKTNEAGVYRFEHLPLGRYTDLSTYGHINPKPDVKRRANHWQINKMSVTFLALHLHCNPGDFVSKPSPNSQVG